MQDDLFVSTIVRRKDARMTLRWLGTRGPNIRWLNQICWQGAVEEYQGQIEGFSLAALLPEKFDNGQDLFYGRFLAFSKPIGDRLTLDT